MGVIYLAYWMQWETMLQTPGKRFQESLALVLLGLAGCASAARYWSQRQLWHLVLLFATVPLFCREIHFRGTSEGLYIGLALIGVWSWRYRRQLLETVMMGQTRFWLISTAGTYLLAILIAQRVLRYVSLPYEDDLHTKFEEIVENVAHLLFLVTILVGGWGRRARLETKE